MEEAPEEKAEEEEAAGDLDDPFAMMGGMGEETVYKVTLMEEAPEEKAEEEEAAGDLDDPFAMMGGMGEETVYKVTLMEEASEDKEKSLQEQAAWDAKAAEDARQES